MISTPIATVRFDQLSDTSTFFLSISITNIFYSQPLVRPIDKQQLVNQQKVKAA